MGKRSNRTMRKSWAIWKGSSEMLAIQMLVQRLKLGFGYAYALDPWLRA